MSGVDRGVGGRIGWHDIGVREVNVRWNRCGWGRVWCYDVHMVVRRLGFYRVGVLMKIG